MSTEENAQNNKANLKLFGIIVGAILAAAVVILGVYLLVDNYKASAARSQAAEARAQASVREAEQQQAAEQARVEQARKEAILKQTKPLQDLRGSITSSLQTITNYQTKEAENCEKGSIYCGTFAEAITMEQAGLQEWIKRYNDQASKLDPTVLRSSNPPLPISFDKSGNPVNQ